METKINMKTSISDAIDGELNDAQLDEMLAQLRRDDDGQLMKTWSDYHLIGDVLRSEDLDITMSQDFSRKLLARLESEPILFVPKSNGVSANQSPMAVAGKSRYMAITSIAAAVMVAFVMAPQIISTINHSGQEQVVATKNEGNDAFGSNIKLASNSNSGVPAPATNAVNQTSNGTNNKDMEFAPKLEDQVEMLRDPRLDSYLQAHQKVSPTLESGARHIQKANVVPTPNEK